MPKVNPRIVEDMEKRYAAVVKAMSLDVTLRQSLGNVLNTVPATMPGISAAVNGAMVLKAALFANMTLENFTDQAFHDASLDFFIVASSTSSIIGWTGQRNYPAANDWMTSLVCNRRARGVPASTVNIPAVLGAGVAVRSDDFDCGHFESLGHINIYEEDLHALFAA